MFMTYHIDEVAGETPLADRLKDMHAKVFSVNKRTKKRNAKDYNKAVNLKEYGHMPA